MSMKADCMPGSTRTTFAEVEVADDAAATGALDVQLLHHALLDDRDAGFLRGEVDEEFDARDGVCLKGRGRRSRAGRGLERQRPDI